jgi:predicted TIM-barrel fold metal-dependent hydrolase
MITRRAFIKTTALAAGLARCVPRAWAKAAQPGTPVDFDVPADACDCHVHIFGDPQRFPFSPARVYTPESASLEELAALHRALHIDRAVVVQPSVYGTDNSCMLDALRHLGGSARGVAVIDAQTPESALDEMERAGVHGIRLNLATIGITDPAVARRRFQEGVDRIKGRNWHVQIYTQPAIIAAISDQVRAAPVPVVFDHFGGATAAHGLQQPGVDALLDLLRSGHAYVKISGAADYVSAGAADYADVVPFAQALITANPERVLWATNWPHPDSARVPGRKATDIAPLMRTDDGRVLNLLPTWAPDAAARRTILVENPARLYGF